MNAKPSPSPSPSPFVMNGSEEILTKLVTDKDSIDLVIALLSISLVFGLDRTEAAIKATYTSKWADQIISGMNLAISTL